MSTQVRPPWKLPVACGHPCPSIHPLLSPLEHCGNPAEAIQLWEESQQLLFTSSCCLPAGVRYVSLEGRVLCPDPTPVSPAATSTLHPGLSHCPLCLLLVFWLLPFVRQNTEFALLIDPEKVLGGYFVFFHPGTSFS